VTNHHSPFTAIEYTKVDALKWEIREHHQVHMISDQLVKDFFFCIEYMTKNPRRLHLILEIVVNRVTERFWIVRIQVKHDCYKRLEATAPGGFRFRVVCVPCVCVRVSGPAIEATSKSEDSRPENLPLQPAIL